MTKDEFLRMARGWANRDVGGLPDVPGQPETVWADPTVEETRQFDAEAARIMEKMGEADLEHQRQAELLVAHFQKRLDQAGSTSVLYDPDAETRAAIAKTLKEHGVRCNYAPDASPASDRSGTPIDQFCPDSKLYLIREMVSRGLISTADARKILDSPAAAETA